MKLPGFPGIEIDVLTSAVGTMKATAQFHTYAVGVSSTKPTAMEIADRAEQAARSCLKYAGLCAAIAFKQDIGPWLSLGLSIIAIGRDDDGKERRPNNDVRGVVHLIDKSEQYVEIKWDDGGVLRQTFNDLADELRAEEVLRLA